MFLVFAGICFLLLIIAILYVSRTKGVPIEDIEENVLQGAVLRDLRAHRRAYVPEEV